MKAAINPTTFKKEAVSRPEIIYQELINSTPPAPRDEWANGAGR